MIILSFFKLHMWNMQEEYLLRIHYKNSFKDHIQGIYFKNRYDILFKT